MAAVKGRLRPTAAKVREALFSILGDRVAGTRVLDLFAGTGALGIEALSRGSVEAVFVEDHPASLKVLRRNLEDLELAGRSRIIARPVLRALKLLAGQGEVFHLAFLDPPYGLGMAQPALEALDLAGLLLPEGLAVVEHSRRETLPDQVGRLQLNQCRRYGDTQVAIYEVREIPQEQELKG